MFDTHCHLAFAAFAGRVERILSDAEAAGVCGAITVPTTSRDCLEGLDLARGHVRVWCTAGVHPLSANQPRDWSNIKAVAQDDRCVAWGELGLDHAGDIAAVAAVASIRPAAGHEFFAAKTLAPAAAAPGDDPNDGMVDKHQRTSQKRMCKDDASRALTVPLKIYGAYTTIYYCVPQVV